MYTTLVILHNLIILGTELSESCSHDGKEWINCAYSVTIEPFCFSFSVQYSISCMSYPILNYTIGFVLDDFAKL